MGGAAACSSPARGSAEEPQTAPGVYCSSALWCVVVVGSLSASASASTTGSVSSGSGSGTKVPSTWTSGASGSYCWQLASSSGSFLMFRALRPGDRKRRHARTRLALSVRGRGDPCLLPARPLLRPDTNFAVIDNWRFWIIHLWVEGFFEIFATVLVAIMFHQMGLVSDQDCHAPDLSGRHPVSRRGDHRHRPPLVLHGPGNAEHGSRLGLLGAGSRAADPADPGRLGFRGIKDRPARPRARVAGGQMWAIYFLMAVGFWNFVGAGVFGFLINLPIVSYFEVGTLLTSNHGARGHVRRLRDAWPRGPGLLPAGHADRRGLGGYGEVRRVGFWGLNAGLALMVLTGPVPRWRPSAVGLHQPRVLARTSAHLPNERTVPYAGMGTDLRRLRLPNTGCGADPDGSASIAGQAGRASVSGSGPHVRQGAHRRRVGGQSSRSRSSPGSAVPDHWTRS